MITDRWAWEGMGTVPLRINGPVSQALQSGSRQTAAEQVPRRYSRAGKNARSLTLLGMTTMIATQSIHALGWLMMEAVNFAVVEAVEESLRRPAPSGAARSAFFQDL